MTQRGHASHKTFQKGEIQSLRECEQFFFLLTIQILFLHLNLSKTIFQLCYAYNFFYKGHEQRNIKLYQFMNRKMFGIRVCY